MGFGIDSPTIRFLKLIIQLLNTYGSYERIIMKSSDICMNHNSCTVATYTKLWRSLSILCFNSTPCLLIHWGRMPYSYISKRGDHCFRYWRVACLATNHHLIWCRIIAKIDHWIISLNSEMNEMRLNMSSAKWCRLYRASMSQNASIHFNIHYINSTCT